MLDVLQKGAFCKNVIQIPKCQKLSEDTMYCGIDPVLAVQIRILREFIRWTCGQDRPSASVKKERVHAKPNGRVME